MSREAIHCLLNVFLTAIAGPRTSVTQALSWSGFWPPRSAFFECFEGLVS